MRQCVSISKKIFALVPAVLILLLVCVGCDSSSVEPDESQATVYVRFYDDVAQSRGVNVKDEQLDASKVEKLYWTYTAKKLAGLYTVGETLVEKPVKPGPAKGLTGNVGPFSVGRWEFTINGYENPYFAEDSLVYSGTANATLEIDTTSPPTPTEVFFEVADRRTGIGRLTFGNMSMTIPGGQWLSHIDADGDNASAQVKVTATVKDTEAEATQVVSIYAPYQAGSVLPIGVLSFTSPTEAVSNGYVNLNAGNYTLEFTAHYKDEYSTNWAEIGTLSNYNVIIHGGMKTTVSGDINNAIFNRGDMEPEGFNVGSVARIGTGSSAKYYPSLEEASKDAATSGQTIVLLADIGPNSVHTDKLHTSATSVKVDPNGHFIDKLTIGSGKTLTIQIGAKTYAISGGILTNFSYAGNNVSITTDGVTSGGVTSVTVNAAGDTVYHAGTMAESSGAVTVTNASSYKLATSGTISSVVVSAGASGSPCAFTIDGGAHISTLDVTSNHVTLKGSLSSVVDAYKAGSSETSSMKGQVYNVPISAEGIGAYKKITLVKNGGETESDFYCYGIEGMKITVPENNPFTFTEKTFMHWVDSATPAVGTGERYFGGDEFVVAGDKSLYAMWAQPVGGRIFTVTGFDKDKYYFYGLQKTELTEWYNVADGAKVAKLQDAVYYSATENGKVLVAYTISNPVNGVRPAVGFGFTDKFRSDVSGVVTAATVLNGVKGWEVGTSAEYDLLKTSGISDVFNSRFWAMDDASSPTEFKLYNSGSGEWDVIPETDTTTKGSVLPIRAL